MEINLLFFLLLSFATFRLTRLIVSDKITELIRKPFLEEIEEVNEKGEIEHFILIKGKGFKGFIGELLSCYWCTGMWCAIGLVSFHYFFPFIGQIVILILAVAGLGGVIETIVRRLL